MRRLVLFLALVVGGCSPTAQLSPTPSLVDAQRTATAAPANQRIESGLVARYGGAYRHEPAEAIVRETLADLVRAAGTEDLPGSVTVLNSSTYNAFSLANGQLFVTRGMLALANDQAELAAALAHELGHVIARHAAGRLVARAKAVADTVEIAKNTGDEDITRAAITASQLSLAAFSRNQELEADRISLELLGKAGYDPAAVLRLLRSLDRMGGLPLKFAGLARRAPSPVASHPPTPERVAAVSAALRGRPGGRTGRERFLAAISGVAFGEDGSGGFVRGRTYVNPELDIAFTLPPSYLLFSGGAGIGAIRQGGKTVAVIAPASPALAADPEGALRRMLANTQAGVLIAPLPAGGVQGASAAFEKDDTSTRLAIVSTGASAWRVLFIANPADASIDRDFMQTLASLRPLDPRDRQLARPLALRIARVEGLADIRRFAERAGDADNGANLILALNGISDTAGVRAGVALKVPEFTVP